MLVRFISSETGEILMFAEAAKVLLEALGKETGPRGAFTKDEMADAALRLRQAIERAGKPPVPEAEGESAQEPVVGVGQRAWPLIDMLERTSRGGAKANIVWEASGPF